MVSFGERGGAYADEVYGWAKLMGERSLQAYEEQYDIDASIVRIFTAYVPRENETYAIIALMAKAVAEQEPFEIWGDGEQTRNFTYVRDITRALRLAAENITDATPVNAGIEEYISINEVVERIFTALGWQPTEVDYMTDKPVGVRHRAADTSRAEELLGWTPEYTLEQGNQKHARLISREPRSPVRNGESRTTASRTVTEVRLCSAKATTYRRSHFGS